MSLSIIISQSLCIDIIWRSLFTTKDIVVVFFPAVYCTHQSLYVPGELDPKNTGSASGLPEPGPVVGSMSYPKPDPKGFGDSVPDSN